MAMNKALENQFKTNEAETLGQKIKVLNIGDTGVIESSAYGGKEQVRKYVVQKQVTFNFTTTIEHLLAEKAELEERLNEINLLIAEIQLHEKDINN